MYADQRNAITNRTGLKRILRFADSSNVFIASSRMYSNMIRSSSIGNSILFKTTEFSYSFSSKRPRWLTFTKRQDFSSRLFVQRVACDWFIAVMRKQFSLDPLSPYLCRFADHVTKGNGGLWEPECSLPYCSVTESVPELD